jgi:hypothetical protein
MRTATPAASRWTYVSCGSGAGIGSGAEDGVDVGVDAGADVGAGSDTDASSDPGAAALFPNMRWISPIESEPDCGGDLELGHSRNWINDAFSKCPKWLGDGKRNDASRAASNTDMGKNLGKES